jgi:hypothetical protein
MLHMSDAMTTLIISELMGKQTRADTLASTDTKALTAYMVIATPVPRVWYQVWNHGMQIMQTCSLPKAVNAYNAAEE